jgi:hypothetical protein
MLILFSIVLFVVPDKIISNYLSNDNSSLELVFYEIPNLHLPEADGGFLIAVWRNPS